MLVISVMFALIFINALIGIFHLILVLIIPLAILRFAWQVLTGRR